VIHSGIILAVILAVSSPDRAHVAHNGPRKLPCVECHVHLPFPGTTLSLRDNIGELCNPCHLQYHGMDAMRSHPVHQVPSIKIPPDMLLDNRGRIVCITCHAYHGEYRDEKGNKKYYLRRTPGKTFCFSCHKNIPGTSTKP
jgi:predicted CXXCH cytochrome family protein